MSAPGAGALTQVHGRPIVEIVDDDTPPSEEEVFETFNAQLHNMVDHFWQQTNQLALEHSLLASRQNRHAHSQHEALMAVHRNAESQVEALTARQDYTTAQIERALFDARTNLQRQLMELAQAQEIRLGEGQASLQAQIAQLVANAQTEAVATHEALTDQASSMMRLEHHVEQIVQDLQEELSARVHDFNTGRHADTSDIRATWASLESDFKSQLETIKTNLVDECVEATQRRLRSDRPTFQYTKMQIQRAIAEVEEQVEKNIQEAFQAARDGDGAREQELMEAAEKASREADALVERRLREEMSEGQAKLDIEIRAQSTAVSALELRINHVCTQLSQRISALEAGSYTPSSAEQLKIKQTLEGQELLGGRIDQLERRMHEMERRLQEDIKNFF